MNAWHCTAWADKKRAKIRQDGCYRNATVSNTNLFIACGFHNLLIFQKGCSSVHYSSVSCNLLSIDSCMNAPRSTSVDGCCPQLDWGDVQSSFFQTRIHFQKTQSSLIIGFCCHHNQDFMSTFQNFSGRLEHLDAVWTGLH